MTPKMRDRGLIALEMRLKGDTYANIGRVLGVSRNESISWSWESLEEVK